MNNYLSHIKNFSVISSFTASLPGVVGLLVLAVLTFVSVRAGAPAFKLVTFFYIFLKLVQSLSEINQTSANIRLAQPSLNRLLEWEAKITQAMASQSGSIHSGAKINSFQQVSAKIDSFSYANETILKNINVKLNKGDVFIIKGPSGVGKSTLLGLLLGILRTAHGSVEINGIPADQVISENSDLIAYVGPEPFLIQGTLNENLRYGTKTEISNDQIYSVLKKVDLMNLIQTLPNGLDQNLSEVAELSTGQRQRLSIARALLRTYDLLVLDEATANLDSETETQVINAIMENFKEKILSLKVR